MSSPHLAPYSQCAAGYYSNIDGSGPYAKDSKGVYHLMCPPENGGGGGGGGVCDSTEQALLDGRLFYYHEKVVTDDLIHVYKLSCTKPVLLRSLSTEIDQGGMEAQLVSGCTFPSSGTILATHNANLTSSAVTAATVSGFPKGSDATGGVVIGASMARAANGGQTARASIAGGETGSPLVLSAGDYCVRLTKHQASSYIGLYIIWEELP